MGIPPTRRPYSSLPRVHMHVWWIGRVNGTFPDWWLQSPFKNTIWICNISSFRRERFDLNFLLEVGGCSLWDEVTFGVRQKTAYWDRIWSRYRNVFKSSFCFKYRNLNGVYFWNIGGSNMSNANCSESYPGKRENWVACQYTY